MNQNWYTILTACAAIAILYLTANASDGWALFATKIADVGLLLVICELYERFWLTRWFDIPKLISNTDDEDSSSVAPSLQRATSRIAVAVYTGCKWIGIAICIA